MDPYGTREVQNYLIPILEVVDKICRENHIEYSLMGGGLLGTVRHQGFVPWDDDLDVVFSRPEYDRFLEVCKTQLPSEYRMFTTIWVKRITRNDNPWFPDDVGCLDLFVFDNIPDNMLVREIKHFLLKMLQGMMKEKPRFDNMSLFHKFAVMVTYVLGQIFPKELKREIYSAISQWGNGSDSRYVNNYVTYFNMISSKKYEKRATQEYMDAEFENRTVRIFKDYDSILKTQFGNYHILPPEEVRRPTHMKPHK